jgi:hypothetical protein
VRGTAGRHASAPTRIRLEQPPSGPEGAEQLVIGEGTHGRPRIQPIEEGDLALVHVADTGHRSLIEQRIPELLAVAIAQVAQCFIGVE